MFLNKLFIFLSIIFYTISAAQKDVTAKDALFPLETFLFNPYTSAQKTVPFEYEFKTYITPLLKNLFFVNKELNQLCSSFRRDLSIIQKPYNIPSMYAAELMYHRPYFKSGLQLFDIVENEALSEEEKIVQIEELRKNPNFDINCSRYTFDTDASIKGVQTSVSCILYPQQKKLLNYFKDNNANFFLAHHRGENYLTAMLDREAFNLIVLDTIPYFNPIPKQSFKSVLYKEKISIKEMNIIQAMLKNGAQLSDINWDKVQKSDQWELYLKNNGFLDSDKSLPKKTNAGTWFYHKIFSRIYMFSEGATTGLCQKYIEEIKEKNYNINNKRYDRTDRTLLLHVLLNDVSTNDRVTALKNTVRELLEMGTDPNAYDDKGNTPLHYIIQSKNSNELKQELCELLITYGADPMLTNFKSETFFDLFLANCTELVSRKLKKNNESLLEYFFSLPSFANYKKAEYFIESALRNKEINLALLLLQQYTDTRFNLNLLFHSHFNAQYTQDQVILLNFIDILSDRTHMNNITRKTKYTDQLFNNILYACYKSFGENIEQAAITFTKKFLKKAFVCIDWYNYDMKEHSPITTLLAFDMNFIRHQKFILILVPIAKKYFTISEEQEKHLLRFSIASQLKANEESKNNSAQPEPDIRKLTLKKIISALHNWQDPQTFEQENIKGIIIMISIIISGFSVLLAGIIIGTYS